MARAVQMSGPGGPGVLGLVETGTPSPGPGEVSVRHGAVGVNFIDIYHRIGLYPLAAYPAILGVEGAGVVTAVGDGVTGLGVGSRVAYAGAPVGSYATERLLPASRAVPLPDGVTELAAASSLVRGLTAHMLLHRTLDIRGGETLLVHAGAGGLGQILIRWARHLGCRVIATAGSRLKAGIAEAAGADAVILHTDIDFAAEVRRLTGGRGADAAVDGIGGDVLARTLSCVRPFGKVASIGQAGGPIPALNVDDVGPRRCLTLARPSVMAYAADAEIYGVAAVEVLGEAMQPILQPSAVTYALGDAAVAHGDLEAGRTTGSVVLTF